MRRDTGRPELAYGRRCPATLIEHEVRVTDFALRYPDATIERGVAVGGTEPDGVLTLAGRRCCLEIDNSGKMDRKQMAAKWQRYAGVDAFILVVCLTEGRLARLRAGAEPVRDRALFTTFRRLASGDPTPWLDFTGVAAGV